MRLTERRDARTRCSICHGEQGSLATCFACGTLYHRDCRGSLARCPTLGCAPVASSNMSERRWSDEDRRAHPWPVGWLYLTSFVVSVVFVGWLPNHPGRVGEFSLALVAGYAAAVFLRTTVAAIRDERGDAWKLHAGVLVTAPFWAAGLGHTILHFWGPR